MSQHSVAFHTLGCKTNQLETSTLAETFQARGWRVVPFDEAASVYVINTCTVTERSDQESRRVIRRARLSNPNARIAVTGCYAQIAPDEVAALDGVHVVVGNQLKDQLAQIVETAMATDTPVIQVTEIDKSRVLAGGTVSAPGRTRGSLKIQDGCDYKCTYCIIWEARGPSRCLSVPDVQTQLARMVAEGFKEVVLTGINIGQYDWQGTDLAGLLRNLIQVEGDFRLRLSSLDPLEVTPELIAVMADSQGKICPHLHLSAQSADDMVLKRMARRHHVDHFQAVCQQFTQAMPQGCIGSDIIVGFPGETDAQFENTARVLAETPIHYFHVFSYSRRRGTPAASLPQQVPQRQIQARARQLTALSEEKFLAFREGLMGKTVEVIVEESGNKGMSEQYCHLNLVGPAPLSQNQKVLARLIDADTARVEAVL
jgi:threonylcarbamoyladenosine tRNA methylthiotransferase MtaB